MTPVNIKYFSTKATFTSLIVNSFGPSYVFGL